MHVDMHTVIVLYNRSAVCHFKKYNTDWFQSIDNQFLADLRIIKHNIIIIITNFTLVIQYKCFQQTFQ